MIGDNSPSEFELNQDNFLDVLIEWMPDQLHNMRQYASGTIKIDCGMESIECQYMRTAGGEKFRVVNQTMMGSSGSVYFSPVGEDEEIIFAFSERVGAFLNAVVRMNNKFGTDRATSLKMTFEPGPFSQVHQVSQPKP